MVNPVPLHPLQNEKLDGGHLLLTDGATARLLVNKASAMEVIYSGERERFANMKSFARRLPARSTRAASVAAPLGSKIIFRMAPVESWTTIASGLISIFRRDMELLRRGSPFGRTICPEAKKRATDSAYSGPFSVDHFRFRDTSDPTKRPVHQDLLVCRIGP